jgi:hypothetical protein
MHRAHVVPIPVRRLPEQSHRLRRDAQEPQKSYRFWLDEQRSRSHDVGERRQELAAIKNATYALEGELDYAQASGMQNACRECAWAHYPPFPDDTIPAKQIHVIPPPPFGTRVPMIAYFHFKYAFERCYQLLDGFICIFATKQ